MDVDTSVLEDLGLTNAQTKVYLTLLEIGESKTGGIIKKSSMQSSVVYNSLTQLVERGLTTFILKGKIKYFSATDPENLIKYIDDKKEKLKEILPNLQRKLETHKQEAQVYLGWKGIYNAFNKILEVLPKGGDYLAFGAAFEEQHTEEAKQFFREYQKKRAEMKLNIQIIVNESARKQVENYKWYPKYGSPHYRFVEGFAMTGSIAFGDNVLICAFEETPIAVIITSKTIAHTYRKAIKAMWKIAKD